MSAGIEQWMGALTDQGFDLVKIDGWTSRNPPELSMGDVGYNHNMPMQHIEQHYGRVTYPKDGRRKPVKTDVRVSLYSCNSRNWTLYACVNNDRTYSDFNEFKEAIK